MSDWGEYGRELLTAQGRRASSDIFPFEVDFMLDIDDFEGFLETQGLSKGTIGTYMRIMRLLRRRRNLLAVLNDDKSMATKDLYLAAIRQWAVFQDDQELLAEVNSPAVRKKVKAAGSRLPKVVEPLTDEEFELFMRGLDALKDTDIDAWVWPALSILVNLGLRAGVDLCGLRKEEAALALRTGVLRLWTKGGRYRNVPSGIVKEELEALVAIPNWTILSDLIVPGSKSPASSAYAAINRILKTLGSACGLDPDKLHAHRFRHSAAMRLYVASGYDLHLVQKLLGHSQIETTAHYLRADRSEEINTQLMSMKHAKKTKEST